MPQNCEDRAPALPYEGKRGTPRIKRYIARGGFAAL
jgi:hypothetical protein